MEKKPGLWKKGDRVILGGSILLCLASFLWILPFSSPQQVTITVGGQIYGRYLITQNQVIHIRQQTGAYNCVEIENGGVSMTPGQLSRPYLCPSKEFCAEEALLFVCPIKW